MRWDETKIVPPKSLVTKEGSNNNYNEIYEIEYDEFDYSIDKVALIYWKFFFIVEVNSNQRLVRILSN